jgi:hypothetical protein
MGEGAPETFRGRVYGGDETDAARTERRRRQALVAAQSPDGLIECPAYDEAIAYLRDTGALRAEPERRPAEGGGFLHVWRAR